eukprot:m.8328 g.8328  ORF g.8328 m.8328 type:complete len:79 (-) comp4050_c0_seq1:37-273(-)
MGSKFGSLPPRKETDRFSDGMRLQPPRSSSSARQSEQFRSEHLDSAQNKSNWSYSPSYTNIVRGRGIPNVPGHSSPSS